MHTVSVAAASSSPAIDRGSSSASSDTAALDRVALLVEFRATVNELRSRCEREALAFTEHDCLAFLRAVKNEQPRANMRTLVDAAFKRLRSTAAWRTTMKLDLCMLDDFWLAQELEYRKLLLYDIIGHDASGRPVLVERCGAWDIEAVLASAESDPQRFATLHCMVQERMRRQARPAGCCDPYGTVIIIDLAGLSTHHLKHARAIAKVFITLARLDSAHYPDSLSCLFIVNAPTIFAVLAGLVRPFLPEATLSKLHVARGVPDALIQTTGREVLPSALGGARQCFPYHIPFYASAVEVT